MHLISSIRPDGEDDRNNMTPLPEASDPLERRLDTMERRQDERHKENAASLRELNDKLNPLIVDSRQIMGDTNYRGRMRITEDNVQEIRAALEGIKITIAKWSGAIIVIMGLITLIEKIFLK